MLRADSTAAAFKRFCSHAVRVISTWE